MYHNKENPNLAIKIKPNIPKHLKTYTQRGHYLFIASLSNNLKREINIPKIQITRGKVTNIKTWIPHPNKP